MNSNTFFFFLRSGKSLLCSLTENSFGKFLTVGTLLFIATACGSKNQFVQDVNLSIGLENENVWLETGAKFNLGGMSMTSIQLPIKDPDDPTIEYGRLSIIPTLDGKTEISGAVNLTDAAQVPGGLATLPNGNPLPIGGIDNVDVIELKLDQINSKIYMALDREVVLFGFGIAIDQFDEVARYTGGLNFFPGFEIKGVKGMAGLFTGLNPGESGLAFFVDVSQVINPEILEKLIRGEPISEPEFEDLQSSQESYSDAYTESPLNFDTDISSKWRARKALRQLSKMSKRGQQLDLAE